MGELGTSAQLLARLSIILQLDKFVIFLCQVISHLRLHLSHLIYFMCKFFVLVHIHALIILLPITTRRLETDKIVIVIIFNFVLARDHIVVGWAIYCGSIPHARFALPVSCTNHRVLMRMVLLARI